MTLLEKLHNFFSVWQVITLICYAQTAFRQLKLSTA